MLVWFGLVWFSLGLVWFGLDDCLFILLVCLRDSFVGWLGLFASFVGWLGLCD